MYGCRVMQKLIEFCSLNDIRDVVMEEVIESLTDLSTSEYGNYVVQQLVENGGPAFRSKVA